MAKVFPGEDVDALPVPGVSVWIEQVVVQPQSLALPLLVDPQAGMSLAATRVPC